MPSDTYENLDNQSADDHVTIWRKSSSSWGNGNCVEVAGLSEGVVSIRDSRSPRTGRLRVSAVQWRVFVNRVRDWESDREQEFL